MRPLEILSSLLWLEEHESGENTRRHTSDLKSSMIQIVRNVLPKVTPAFSSLQYLPSMSSSLFSSSHVLLTSAIWICSIQFFISAMTDIEAELQQADRDPFIPYFLWPDLATASVLGSQPPPIHPPEGLAPAAKPPSAPSTRKQAASTASPRSLHTFPAEHILLFITPVGRFARTVIQTWYTVVPLSSNEYPQSDISISRTRSHFSRPNFSQY